MYLLFCNILYIHSIIGQLSITCSYLTITELYIVYVMSVKCKKAHAEELNLLLVSLNQHHHVQTASVQTAQ